MPNIQRVAIIGGGISGLATARGLVANGIDVVTLFEARDRVGGRLSSKTITAGAIDLGATWFWPGEHRVAALVAELDVEIHEQWLEGDALHLDATGVQRLRGNPLDVPSFRFSHGAADLATRLADALPKASVHTGICVRRIHREVDGVRVELDGDREGLLADAVVIALPPSLALSSGLIDAASLEPSVVATARRTPVWMGAMTKAVAVFATPFWREAGLSGSAYCPKSPMQELHDMSGPGGQPASVFGFRSSQPGHPKLTEHAVVEQLSALFGAQAAHPLHIEVCDWSAEPYTSPPDVHLHDEYQRFGAAALQVPAWDGRLLWTSTETSPVAPGHIEGALAAAERTIAALTPQR